MKRYLKVWVSKEQESEVYLCVDDTDSRFSSYFEGDKKLRRVIHSSVVSVAESLAEDLDSLDWSDASYAVSRYPVEVSQKEAEDYGCEEMPSENKLE